MSTIDEILERGWYTDRRRRFWAKRPSGVWAHTEQFVPGLGVLYSTRLPDQMRLLIERDRHRDECPGLADCMTHPVLAVIVCYEHGEGWGLFKVGVRAQSLPTIRRTLPEAMDAARALAVNP